MSDLFGPLFGNPVVDREVSSAAWVRAMLDFERALAAVQIRFGVVPAFEFPVVSVDPAWLGAEAVASGNPVVPLVKGLRSSAPWVHHGATSQDVLDTALSLVARRALVPLLEDLRAVADAVSGLAGAHRDTVMVGRTLFQHAVPTTFGYKCAGWLVALDRCIDRVGGVQLAVQFGGAVGTLAALGSAAPTDLIEALAAELGLAAPLIPWHTDRARIVDLASALGATTGVLGKIATDVLLMSQTEVAEVAEQEGGESSAMPHKQNPVRSVLVQACAKRTPALVHTLFATMSHEHERAGGAWHAEWETVTDLLRLTGGAAHHARNLIENLRVDPAKMRRNLDATSGLVMAERLVAALGRAKAQDVVTKAARSGTALRDVLLADPEVRLTEHDVDDVLDPAAHLGGAGAFVDRALAAHAGKESP